MIKKMIVIKLLLISIILGDDTLFDILKNSNESQSSSFLDGCDTPFEDKKEELPLIIQAYNQNLKESKKWKIDTIITRHQNPKLNSIDSPCIDCGLDKALGVIGQIQYHTTDSFVIGIKATILNNEDEDILDKESSLDNVRLNSFCIVCTLML
jgi:hypothetical protein